MSEQFVGTMPVQEKHRFDVSSLERYMRTHVEGFSGPLSVDQFKGGQSNPTYKLSAGGTHYVMRRKPAGKLLASAHAVDREYRVITALHASTVPVARTYCLCEDASVIGTPFYIMEWVNGRVLWDPKLPEMTPGERGAIYRDMNHVIAALHRVDYERVGLRDYGRPGNYIERQIARWTRQYRASESEALDAMDRLIDWLPANLPPGEETSLVHGDYRLENLIFHPSEPRVIAVLDWELSTLGHPLADFAYHCMSWHLPVGLFHSGLSDLDLTALGIPSEAEYVAEYLHSSGRGPIDPDHWAFYVAYTLFRGAAILQGIMGRVKDGTAASAQALDTARGARPMGELAWRQVEKILARG